MNVSHPAKAGSGISPEGVQTSWFTFGAVAAAGLALCLWGGRFGYIGVHAYRFMVLWALTWAISMALTILLPKKRNFLITAAVILGLALIARLLLLPHPAASDVNRYLWEGRVIANGLSPYTLPPTSPDLAFLRDDVVWPRVNLPHLTAIYPPLSLLVFSGIARIWYAPMAVKLVMVVFDLGTLICLIQLLKARHLPIRYAFLYAFNPVILYGFAARGHLDAMQVFFLTAALLARIERRPCLMFLCLGLAFQSKYTSLAAAPFFLTRGNFRRSWVGLAAGIFPFLYFIPQDGLNVFHTLTKFGGSMYFNGSVHGLLLWLTGNKHLAAAICYLCLSSALVWSYRRLHPDIHPAIPAEKGIAFALGAFLIFAPTVYYWYLTWIIPFIVLSLNRPWLMLCLFMAAQFGVFHNSYHHQKWDLDAWMRLLEWGPFFLLLAPALWKGWHRLKRNDASSAPRSVSVVIPTLNEADYIDRCLTAIGQDPVVEEIIVVDAGSTDRTVELASRPGIRIIHAPRGIGRGGQIRLGVNEASGDVVAVVHGDAIPAFGVFGRMIEVLSANPGIVGGAAGISFNGRGTAIRLVEAANDLRAVLLDISFGDQIQFFRRQPAVAEDLPPDIPLMEDVELSLRLSRLGETTFLWSDSRVSPRRWRQRPFRRVGLILTLFSRYLLTRLFKEPNTHAMYEKYYGRKAN